MYLAEQISLSRQVAIKVLPAGRSLSSSVLARFRREAAAASKLDHPHICAVYASGVHDGTPYIAMRHVEGKPLSKIMRERRRGESEPSAIRTDLTFRFDFDAVSGSGAMSASDDSSDLTVGERSGEVDEALLDDAPADAPSSVTHSREPIRWAVEVMEKAARAVEHAHESRIIHRDIKPGNIMLAPDDEPVLLDFGLARAMEDHEEGPSLTQSGDVMGTPHYMSPEQLSGSGRVDARTDVYSLGVTLYELVLGRRPFEALNRERLYHRILSGDPPSPSSVNPLVERDLAIVLDTAIDRELGRRYQTARAFADDLRAVLDHEPIAARPVGPVLRTKKWLRRNPVVATIGLATLLVLGLLLAESWFYSRQLEDERNIALQAKNDADLARADADTAAARAQATAERNAKLVRDLEVTLNRSEALRLAAEATARATKEPAVALALARKAADLESTVETDRALRVALRSIPEQLLLPAPTFESLAGEVLPQPGDRSNRTQLDPRVRRLRGQTPVTGDVHWGRGLAVTLANAAGGVPVVWDLATGRHRSVLGAHSGHVYTARFSKDGQAVVTASEDGTSWVFNADTGAPVGGGSGQPLRPDPARIGPRQLQLTEFGPADRFLIGVADDVICAWRRRGRALVKVQTQPLYRAVQAPPLAVVHGRFPLIANASSGRVVIWTPFDGSSTILPGRQSEVSALTWSAATDTRRLAVGYADGYVSVFDIRTLKTRPTRSWGAPLNAHSGAITRIAFSPDGRWLATGSDDRRCAVWNVETQRPRWSPWLHGGAVRDLAWSSDGALLATGSADGEARVLDASSGLLRQRFAGHGDWVTRVSFSPNADRLFTLSYGGTGRVFPLSSGRRDEYSLVLPKEITSVEWWSLDESRLLIGCRDGTVRSLEATEGRARSESLMTAEELRGVRWIPGTQRYLAMSAGRSWLRCGQQGGAERWVTRRSGLKDLCGGSPRDLMAASDDGTLILATAGGGTPTLLRASDGSVIEELRQLTDPLRVIVAARPGHREFAICAGERAPVLYSPDGPTFRVCSSAASRGICISASFSQSGRYLATTNSDRRVSIHDLSTPGPTPASMTPAPVAVVTPPVWMPDQDALVIAPKDDTVRIVSVDVGCMEQTLSLPTAGMDRLLVTPNGASIVAIIGNELVVWDVARDSRRAAIQLGDAAVEDWALSSLGNRLAMGMADGVVRVIPLNATVEAHGRQVRPLSASEMERFNLGSHADRADRSRRELRRQQAIELEALRGCAQWSRDSACYLSYARRIMAPDALVEARFPDALTAMENVIRLTSPQRNPDHTRLMAWALYHNDRLPEAAETMRQALSLTTRAGPERRRIAGELKRFEDELNGQGPHGR